MLDTLSKLLPRPLLKSVLRWAAVSFALNLVWEVLQLPFYTIAGTQSAPQVAYAVVHCTVGDALIAGTSFLAAAIALRTPDWPAARPWAGGSIALTLGMVYTAYSEWHNVYQTGAWAYSPSMPLIFGIGLAPMLQWLVVPVATLLIFRRGRILAPRFGRPWGGLPPMP